MKKWLLSLSAAAIIAAAPAVLAQGQGNTNGNGNGQGQSAGSEILDGPIVVPEGTHLNQRHTRPEKSSPVTVPAALAGIQTFTYTIPSNIDGKTYTGTMIGQDPTSPSSGTTTVNALIIPVKLDFQFSRNSNFFFDPLAPDTGCIGAGNTALALTQNSPLFQNSSYDYDGTVVATNAQYVDAYQRANFWSTVQSNANYHTILSVAVGATQTVVVSSASRGRSPNGTVFTFAGQCGANTGSTNTKGDLGVMNINFWDPTAQSIISNLHLSPGTFPIFVFYNAVMSEGNPTNLNNCCILGYHNITASGQTYAVAEFEGRENTLFTGVGDITAMSHEIAEWMDDPTTSNPTPAWGHIGQVSTCQSNLENGDPLSGTQFPAITMNGFTYHPQELAFASWFYRTPAPISSGGLPWHSNNGKFTTDAGAVCH